MLEKTKQEPRNGLRPCPFCGKHGTVAAILEADGSTVIRCDPGRRTGGCGISTAPFPTKAEAVNAWNRRTGYIGKGDFEQMDWPYNLVAELFGTDDELNGVELTDDQMKGIDYALGTLTDRERDCTERYYRDGKTLEEIGNSYHVTRERVRQVIHKALRKMRHPIRAKYIRRGYTIASGEAAQRARAEYQAEADRVKAQMLAEVQREVAEQTGGATPEDGQKRNVPLIEMDLSVRSYNCLYRALGSGRTAADVFAVKEPERIRNLGRKSCVEVATKLQDFGFNIVGTGWEPYGRRYCHD